MGKSLLPYLDMKVHPLLKTFSAPNITIIGDYNRDVGVVGVEKQGKLFNYERPTVTIDDEGATVYCFPGWDYVFHFGNIYASYFAVQKQEKQIKCILPDENMCWSNLLQSSLADLPPVSIAILGYVEGLEFLSTSRVWHGRGHFKWKLCRFNTGEGVLLGCEHTYWGEIAGRVVEYLAGKGVETVIYSGKLGSLNPLHTPNRYVATGDVSILPDGTEISWDNIFTNPPQDEVKQGVHITLPSVLEETIEWLNNQNEAHSFVDPEIGHMALAAAKTNIRFSYLHIISDNLTTKYPQDLSNERHNAVTQSRKGLYQTIGTTLSHVL